MFMLPISGRQSARKNCSHCTGASLFEFIRTHVIQTRMQAILIIVDFHLLEHARMGRSLVARGDFNEAITEYTKALSIQEKSELQNDANAKLVLQLISLNRRIGQFDEANRLRSCLRKLKPEGMDIRIKRELMDELYSSDFGLLGF